MTVGAAEHRRNVRIAAWDDLALLDALTESHELTVDEFVAFTNMKRQISSGGERTQRHLTTKQRSWAEEVARRVTPILASDAPRGREVETPAVLRNLPKAPPGRTPR